MYSYIKKNLIKQMFISNKQFMRRLLVYLLCISGLDRLKSVILRG